MSQVRRILATVLVVGAVGALVAAGTRSAFSATTASGSNTFTAGTVQISDNDAGSAMLSLSLARPGDSDTGCILVTYGGSLDASVRLYASLTGTLGPYLNLTITRGTDAGPSFDSCAGFTPDVTNYLGLGAGIVYSGTLAGLPTSYAAGLLDPVSGPLETWTTSESHSYRIRVELANDPAAEGQSATAAFTWEARNQ